MVSFFVAATSDIELVETAGATAQVEAGENRDHHHALHGGGKVASDHLAELVGLAFKAERGALDLLVVLELELEQAHHLDCRPGGARDCDTAVPVGREDLFERAVADQVARGSATVAGQEHAIGEADRNAGRAVAVVVGVERTVDRCGRLRSMRAAG